MGLCWERGCCSRGGAGDPDSAVDHGADRSRIAAPISFTAFIAAEAGLVDAMLAMAFASVATAVVAVAVFAAVMEVIVPIATGRVLRCR